MNMMIRGSANSITSGFPFPLKEALPPGLSASPVFPPACVPCSPLPNILISGRKNGTGSIPVSQLLPAAIYVSRAIARCRSVALTSEKLYHYGLGGPQSVSSRNRKAETRPASYYAVFEMLTREKLREGVLGSNRTAYMNYIVPLLFPDNEMPAGRLRHWAELWREADITSEHVCGMPREQRAYLEAALAGRWIYLRLLQCFWKFKTARRKMFRLRFSKNGIDTLQILGYTLYSAKKFPRSSL